MSYYEENGMKKGKRNKRPGSGGKGKMRKWCGERGNVGSPWNVIEGRGRERKGRRTSQIGGDSKKLKGVKAGKDGLGERGRVKRKREREGGKKEG